MFPRTRQICLSSALFLSLSSSMVIAQVTGSTVSIDERFLSFELPQSVEAGNEGSIAVELDGYDISAFAMVEGNQLDIQLETPLAEGEHNLSVLLFLENGDIEPVLDRQLTVLASDQNSGTWQTNTTFSGNYRIDQKEAVNYEGVKHFASNGALSVRGEETLGKWQLTTEVDAIYDSVSENSPDNNEWALPHYRLATTYQGDELNAGGSVGNIYIEREDLLFSAFQNRGASANIAGVNGGFQVQVFGVQSQPTSRIDSQLVDNDNEVDLTSGATASVAIADQYLQLSAGYISGETRLGGDGFINIDDPTIYGGDSWNLAVDSRWLNSSLWLHLEYAESEFDSDGINIGEEAETDDATQVMLQLSSGGDIGAGWLDYWTTVIQHKSVGTNYYSIGNIAIPGDVEMTRAAFQGGIYGLSMDLEWSEEVNNIDANEFLPTQTLKRQGGTLNYSPMNLNQESWLWRSIGSPSIMTSFYRNTHSQANEDALIAGYDLDNLTDEASLALMFSKAHWNWSVQHQLIEQDDRTQKVEQGEYLLYEPPSDNQNELTALQLGWMPNERIAINVMMQLNKQSEIDFNNDYNNKNYSVDASFQIVPQTLSFMLNYNQGRDTSHLSNDLFIENDSTSQFANAQLSWHALKADSNKPNIDFYLRGSYGKQNNRAFQQINEQWSALLGVELQWAAGGQQ